MDTGQTSEIEYFEEIPFAFNTGLPIIDVEIQGKKYKFLFDTGAPNVISKEVAEEIQHKVRKRIKVKDSTGKSRYQTTVSIDEISIGKINYLNTSALIVDLNAAFEMRCFKFDGIIGANLMAMSVWEIDYERELISFTNKRSNFQIPEDALTLPFYPKKGQKTPKIAVNVDGTKVSNITFDTGAVGKLNLRQENFKDDIDSFKKVELVGSSSAGIYGRSENTNDFYVAFDTLHVGEVLMTDQIIKIESSGSQILGNKFLKRFRVILDWRINKITLIERESYEPKPLKVLGFYPTYKDGKLFVGSIYPSSAVAQSGLQLGDQILGINGKNYKELSEEDACQFIVDKPLKDIETLELQIKRDENLLDFKVRKEIILKTN